MADDGRRRVSNASLAIDALLPALIGIAILVFLALAFIMASPNY
jgi:hypothetical protein